MMTFLMIYRAMRNSFVSLRDAFGDARKMENAAYKRGELVNR